MKLYHIGCKNIIYECNYIRTNIILANENSGWFKFYIKIYLYKMPL